METLTTLSPPRRQVAPRRPHGRRTCRIAICMCPVCRQMGAGRLLTAFAAYARVLNSHVRKAVNLKIMVGTYPGTCTSGPNLTINGRRMQRVRPEDVRPIIRDIMTAPDED